MPLTSSVDERRDHLELSSSPTNESEHGNEFAADRDDALTGSQAWCLYISHFLSMWNSRTYEYGAVGCTVTLLFEPD